MTISFKSFRLSALPTSISNKLMQIDKSLLPRISGLKPFSPTPRNITFPGAEGGVPQCRNPRFPVPEESTAQKVI